MRGDDGWVLKLGSLFDQVHDGACDMRVCYFLPRVWLFSSLANTLFITSIKNVLAELDLPLPGTGLIKEAMDNLRGDHKHRRIGNRALMEQFEENETNLKFLSGILE
jgi:hypothetical protein